MSELDPSIEEILNKFDVKTEESKDTMKTCITLWIPIEYKEKYNLIQKRTNRRFAKILSNIVKLSLDKINID